MPASSREPPRVPSSQASTRRTPFSAQPLTAASSPQIEARIRGWARKALSWPENTSGIKRPFLHRLKMLSSFFTDSWLRRNATGWLLGLSAEGRLSPAAECLYPAKNRLLKDALGEGLALLGSECTQGIFFFCYLGEE